MTPSRKPLALFLTILLALSTVALSSSTNAEETSARVTNNEEIIVSVNEIYYERDSSFSVTFTANNLDPNSEYTVEWQLCIKDQSSCQLYENSQSQQSTEGTIDLGSGNLLSVSTITFTDPGFLSCTYDQTLQQDICSGISNSSYQFKASLEVQGVPLHSNYSDAFVMGGKVTSSNIATTTNILKNMGASTSGRFYLDYNDRHTLNFTIECSIFEDGVTTPADTSSITNIKKYWGDDYTFSFSDLTPTATSGTHYIECYLIRQTNNEIVGTVTSNTFQVID
ncbi:MAG: hypothetical protein VXV89_00950, partial [Candidatus Thermoplasmatota archaeon]|nr:hypothetical protein [Candidatus Thermoplasmatota archaeon]